MAGFRNATISEVIRVIDHRYMEGAYGILMEGERIYDGEQVRVLYRFGAPNFLGSEKDMLNWTATNIKRAMALLFGAPPSTAEGAD